MYNSTSGGEQTPYVTKEVNPKVEGVVVIAEGGGNAVVIKILQKQSKHYLM